jgi:serine/threonine protein kinase/cold shock CspA family protein
VSAAIHARGDTLLGRYRIERYIAEGGMQQVYLATDIVFGRVVALKVPKNPSAEKRFARSAEVSARVNHPNVAKTLDYFEHKGRSYLIEEFVSGQDLHTMLTEKFDFLDPHLAAHVFHHIAKGVAASHHAGVFHRDLKPGNVMISTDPNLHTIKITDFGIAKMAEQEITEGVKDEASITGSQTVMGALPYMAPELIETRELADLPADIWALGAILYLLMAGVPPFGTGLKAVPRILEARLPAEPTLSAMKPQFKPLTDELLGIVQVCLQKESADRPTADKLVGMCSSLCYSCAERKEGAVASFRAGTGAWGFIDSDDGGSVFFHADSFWGRRPTQGIRVNFAPFPGNPQPRAFPILPLKVGGQNA